MIKIYTSASACKKRIIKFQVQRNNLHVEKNIEDDGYGINRKQSIWQSILSAFRYSSSPGTLILVRNGECEFNEKKLFTGWIDADLSELGRREIEHAARLLLERGYTVDISYTSMLKRAVRSSWIILNEINQIYRPTIKSWRLNERMYGALEGLSKPELAKHFGETIVQRWRSGLHDRPPAMTPNHVHWHKDETKYANIDPNILPVTESLQDVVDRIQPLIHSIIYQDLKVGRNVMIVAHGNSLRAIVKIIDNLELYEAHCIGIPNGIPLVYKFDSQMKPIVHKNAVRPLSAIFLEKKGVLALALQREKELASNIEGYNEDNARFSFSSSESKAYYSSSQVQSVPEQSTPHVLKSAEQSDIDSSNATDLDSLTNPIASPIALGPSNTTSMVGVPANLLKKLAILEQEKKLLELLDPDQSKSTVSVKDDSNESIQCKHENATKKASPRMDKTEPVTPLPEFKNFLAMLPPHMKYQTLVVPAAKTVSSTPLTDQDNVLTRRPLLVIIRHGKTEHNKLGLFTGWEDASLAAEGRDEALHAGKLLQKHGVEFDVVYTSWLSRAIETAWLVLNELDLLWLPVVKTWRLNERMYGALTGLSKKMIRQLYGDEQFKKWRRGYDTPPPPISSFSHAYPGNDDRYVNYVQDIKISWFETCIRSLAHGKLEIHLAFPKCESLKDCMDRAIPYYKNVIVPDSLGANKNVLIASSENAIRGLLMHLCDIPVNMIHSVEIPTGLPMIYDAKVRGIKLLCDGSNQNPLEKYNFGDKPELLFKVKQSNHNEPIDYKQFLIPMR